MAGFPKLLYAKENSLGFKVAEYDVRVEQVKREAKNSIEKWSCTCTYSSVQGMVHGCDCSHILCCKAFLMGVRSKE